MTVHRAGCAAKACQGTSAQVTEDPLSFPKAKGGSTVVDLDMKSQDTDEKGKTEKIGQCGAGTRRFKG